MALVPRRVHAECEPPTTLFAPVPQAAVSLRGMVEKALAEGSNGEPFRPMGTLTRLDGYLIDRSGRDLILWGQVEPDAPVLMLDDFLVGLRAAYDQYVVVENGRSVLYVPGISIDVDTRAFKALELFDDLSSDEQQRAYIETCQMPMTLRVEGMPRHTRVSDILLAADYMMKLVVQGKSQIEMNLFFGSMNQRRRSYSQLAEATGAKLSNHGDMTRWWFRSGKFTVQRSPTGDMAFLDRAQVILSVTHERIVGLKQVDANVDDTAEDAYACEWSGRIEETYLADPLWREMRNVFRHFGVARMIRRDGALEASGMDAAPLMTGLMLHEVRIPDAVPGSALIEAEDDGAGGTSYWAHCGGVSVDVSDHSLAASDADDPVAVGAASDAVLTARPTNRPAHWSVG